MKKILSVLLALVLLMSLPVSALTSPAPASLPFELTAPGNVSANWLEGGDSPTTIALAYSLSNDMTAFFRAREEASVNGKLEEFMKPYGIGDIGITTQVDWAVDDVDDPVSGWHYTEYWDANDRYSLGYDDEGRCRVGEWDGVDLWVGNWTETVNNHWVLRGVNEDSVNGNPEEGRPGLKDQMRPDQYSWNGEDLRIDFTQHTVYLRMRFLVTTSKETEDGLKNTYYYSDWSNVAAVGKDAENSGPLKPGDIAAPVIADLHMTDKEFNGNPVVAFTLTVPDELMAGAARVAANGGVIWIETYCRVKGDAEWIQMQNTDHDICIWSAASGRLSRRIPRSSFAAATLFRSPARTISAPTIPRSLPSARTKSTRAAGLPRPRPCRPSRIPPCSLPAAAAPSATSAPSRLAFASSSGC